MNELEQRIAELECENERLKDWRYMLERNIEHNSRIISMLLEEKEDMSMRLMVYRQRLENQKKEEEIEIVEKPKSVKEQVDNILDDLVKTLGQIEFTE